LTPTAQGLELERFDLPALLSGCVENLLAVYDEHQGLFPYSTRVVAGRLVNDYAHPQTIRYTINTLLGLAEAARAGSPDLSRAEVDEMVEAFLSRGRGRVETCADTGLLTVLLAEYRKDGESVAALLGRLRGALSGAVRRRLYMNDIAWATWGGCSAARHGASGGEELATTFFDLIRSEYVDSRSGFPRHSTRRYRRGIVSFGSLVYFLRAAHEYAQTFADRDAESLFVRSVDRAIDLQGPLGEWPWLLGVHTGRPIDVYPVFSVHQDSMAMLFLLPAHDRGMERAAPAIERGLSWCFGTNELGVDFYPRDPFHAYRSIERVERAPRVRRYTRAVVHSLRPGAGSFGAPGVRLNPECRSYHLGWILFVWSGRAGTRSQMHPNAARTRAGGG
jgi:hypothetical protein